MNTREHSFHTNREREKKRAHFARMLVQRVCLQATTARNRKCAHQQFVEHVAGPHLTAFRETRHAPEAAGASAARDDEAAVGSRLAAAGQEGRGRRIGCRRAASRHGKVVGPLLAPRGLERARPGVSRFAPEARGFKGAGGVDRTE